MNNKNIVTGQLAKVTAYNQATSQVNGLSTTGNLTVGGASSLGDIGNINITGGAAGEVIVTDGNGNLSFLPNPIYVVPPVYIVAPFAGNNQQFSNTILASYNSNTEMTVFYNGALLENSYYTLAGDVITVNIPLEIGDGIDVVTTVSANVNSIVSSGYGNSNVAAYLPIYTGALTNLAGDVTTAANVSAVNVNATNVDSTNVAAFAITAATSIVSPLISAGTGNIELSGNSLSSTADTITIDPLGDGGPAGNVAVLGNLSVTGNLTYNDITNATTSNLVWISASDTASAALASGGGLQVGLDNGVYATWTYDNPANVWSSNLGITASGVITGTNIIGEGGNISNIAGGNVIGQVANSLIAGTVYQSAQPNITAVGTLGSLSVAGTTTAAAFAGDGAALTNLTGANVTGQVANALVSGTVYEAAQPNITSLGTLSGLGVSGTTNTGILNATTINATTYTGNGSQLTGILAPVRGTFTVVPGEQLYSFDVPANAAYNITVLGSIPFGIMAYQAQLWITNTNVAAIGTWTAINYSGGGLPIRFVQVPPAYGALNQIVNSDLSGYPTPSNTLRFVIRNDTGVNQTVNWSYIRIS